MRATKISECVMDSSCYECTDGECLRAGDIEADCHAWKCIHPDGELEDCYTCVANEYAVRNGRVIE